MKETVDKHLAEPLIFRRDTCRICGGKSLQLVLSLGSTPPANAFLQAEQLSEPEPKFPLDVFFCKTCSHVQLLDVVSPEILFRNYFYVSSTSPSFVEHFRRYAEDVAKQCSLEANSLVVEIGSNDGILLKHFKAMGQRVVGVDPAVDIASAATAAGVPTLPDFFTAEVAQQILKEHGEASVVTANNVFAHADDLHGILEAVKKVLAPGGVFVFEVSYLMDVYEKTLFDTIYHEHVSYHTVKPLKLLFEEHGMEFVDAIRVSTHGGSLRGIVRRKGRPHTADPSVEELTEQEKAMGLHKAETFVQFAKKVDTLKHEVRELLLELKKQGKRIAGFGAPAKMTTLMHYFEINGDLIDFVVDDSPLKQGLYTPGYHIPVVPTSHLYECKPDYLVIFAWNFAEPIMKKNEKFRQEGGKFIIPVPSPTFVA